MALVTSSALMVNCSEIYKNIQEPMEGCFQTDTKLNNELNYLFKTNETRRFPSRTHNSFNINKKLASFWRCEPNGHTRLVFNIIGPVFYDLACYAHFYETFREYRLVSEETLRKAITVLNSTRFQTIKKTLDIVYRVGFE